MILRKNARVVFAGDSVTDWGRDYQARPAGAGSFGNGYVNLINAFLTVDYPERQIFVANRGFSGDTIVEMSKRWNDEVLQLNPDYVSVMIGANDVWHFFDSTFLQLPVLDDVQEYTQIYEELIRKTEATGAKMILMSPFMFELNTEDPMRKMMDRYRESVQKLSAEHNLVFVDVQKAVDCFLHYQSSYILSNDRVHPNFQGHMLVAQAWLNAVGFDWDRTSHSDSAESKMLRGDTDETSSDRYWWNNGQNWIHERR